MMKFTTGDIDIGPVTCENLNMRETQKGGQK